LTGKIVSIPLRGYVVCNSAVYIPTSYGWEMA